MSVQSANSEIHPAADGQVTKINISSTDPVEISTFHGVENELQILHKMLENPASDGGSRNGFKAIGITGVRGIGKSALCRALLQTPQLKSKFLPRIWVSMSSTKSTHPTQDPKLALLNRILLCLGVEPLDPGTQTLGGLLYALRLQLRGKRYLIVLDDAQEQGHGEELDWYRDLNLWGEIGEKLRDGFRGGKGGVVIVTSRSEKQAKAMVGEGNFRCLVPHKDPECFWQIFCQELQEHPHNIPSLYLKELKVELMNKCGGLPLAAKMMGQIKFHQIQSGNMVNPNPP